MSLFFNQPRPTPKGTSVHFRGVVPQENVIKAGEYISSPNGEFFLTMQHDGNLVLYTNISFQPEVAAWSSNTWQKGPAPHYAKIQEDGNFVVYSADNQPQWASDTWHKGQGPYTLELQDDRNLVLYDVNRTPTWASNTYQQPNVQQVDALNDRSVHNGGTIHQEQVLRAGEYLQSPCYRWYLRMQHDGNLVLYTNPAFTPEYAAWSSNTWQKGPSPHYAKVQQDGNFVVYSADNQPQWASDTWNKGQAPYRLTMQRDRNLVLYDANNTATWASNTWEQVPPELEAHPDSQHYYGDSVHNEQSLHNGQYIRSHCGRYFLTMQHDGNMVLYNNKDFQAEHAVWSSNTWHKGEAPYHAKVQQDGNFVIYDKNNQPTWASDTWNKGQAPYRLTMQEDRNLVLYDKNGTATWSSDTWSPN